MYYTNIIYDGMKMKTSEKIKVFPKLFLLCLNLADCVFRLYTIFFRFLRSQILCLLAKCIFIIE